MEIHPRSTGVNAMKILRIREVLSLTGLSQSTVLRYERRGRFPQRVRMGTATVGWLETDILAWIKALPNGTAKFRIELKT
jgi:prophage regulatory protein